MPRKAKVQSLGSVEVVETPKGILPSEVGLGSNAYSDKTLTKDFSLPIVKKGELVRETWSNTALVLAKRAKKASQTYGKKEFNSLYRLILSASIAMDKAFPQQVQPLSTNMVVNLFSSLGSEQISKILQPALPKIEVVVDDPVVELPSDKPLDDPT